MSADRFIDTNVFVCMLDNADAGKRQSGKAVVPEVLGQGSAWENSTLTRIFRIFL